MDGLDVCFLCNFKQVNFQYIALLSNRPVDFCAHVALLGIFVWKDVLSSEVPLTFVSMLWEESDRV